MPHVGTRLLEERAGLSRNTLVGDSSTSSQRARLHERAIEPKTTNGLGLELNEMPGSI